MMATHPRTAADLVLAVKQYVSQMSPAEAARCILAYRHVDPAEQPVEYLLREQARLWLRTLRFTGDL